MFGSDRQAKGNSSLKNERLLFSRDATLSLPRGDVRWWLSNSASHWADAAEH
jgi:hypothetical protein